MRLSTRGEYGLLAVIDLALQSGEQPVQIQQIARRQGVPKQYLDQLMLSLKKAGLVASSRGRQGGYRLTRPANAITVLEVVTSLEGAVKNVNFLPKGRHRIPARTALRRVWEEAVDCSTAVLRAKTIEDLCKECRSTEQAPMYYI
jgi:Rrf2 family protein